VPHAEEKKKAAPKPRTTSFEASRSTFIGVGVICLVGLLVLFWNWYASQLASLSKQADKAGLARKDSLSLKNLAKAPGAQKTPLKTATPSPGATAAAPGALPDGRVRAPQTKQNDDVVVGVSAARLGPIVFKDSKDATKQRVVDGKYITLELRITNLSRFPFNYKSWSQLKNGILLCDQNRNFYNRVFIDQPPIIEETIPQGQTITDILAFEQPLKNYGYLDLDLPAPNHLQYLFRIYGNLVVDAPLPQKPAAPAGTAPGITVPAPPVVQNQNPEANLQLRGKVRDDYFSSKSSIERRAKGMGFDRGRSYIRTNLEKLINDLAETYNLTPTQVRRMVR
jgi:hypothetical protein